MMNNRIPKNENKIRFKLISYFLLPLERDISIDKLGEMYCVEVKEKKAKRIDSLIRPFSQPSII